MFIQYTKQCKRVHTVLIADKQKDARFSYAQQIPSHAKGE